MSPPSGPLLGGGARSQTCDRAAVGTVSQLSVGCWGGGRGLRAGQRAGSCILGSPGPSFLCCEGAVLLDAFLILRCYALAMGPTNWALPPAGSASSLNTTLPSTSAWSSIRASNYSVPLSSTAQSTSGGPRPPGRRPSLLPWRPCLDPMSEAAASGKEHAVCLARQTGLGSSPGFALDREQWREPSAPQWVPGALSPGRPSDACCVGFLSGAAIGLMAYVTLLRDAGTVSE